ncbi:MAG: T9SS type A sorting domain-containing protein [Ignavibacteriales bacterium]|nr:T9SS type A sorting domain-containing protein [Ignavibacteriales bacterium]
MFLRVDSVTGLIYRYWQELNGEYIFHNLNPEIGDTIFHPAFQENPFYILEDEQPINYLGIDTYERRYWEYLPCSCYHTLIKGFGLARTFFSEFGGSESTLKGCVINGVLYGDTTFVVDVDDKLNLIPTEYKLEQNYPNPFNPSTKISYQLPVSGNVTLKVFDVLGREVATLVDEYRDAGSYNLEFRIENLELSSGIYFYQLKAGEFVETKKMLLIK